MFFLTFLLCQDIYAAGIKLRMDPLDLSSIPTNTEIDLPGATFRLASLASIYEPYMKRKDVKKYIKHFKKPAGLRFVRESLERGMPYIPHIMQKLEEYNLPYELAYLPILESGYRLHAVSPAKAVGAWQFMANYSAPYGLIINQWRDDRRDIVHATDAALKKLRQEIQSTGDLWLAVAAYNGGITRVLRVKRELESMGYNPSYWTMVQHQMLPKETMEYIPKLLAISYIIRYKFKFSPNKLRINQAEENIVFLKNPAEIDLVEMADSIGVDETYLKTLNAGLIRGKTPPPAKDRYLIKVPAYAAESAKDFLASYVPTKKDVPPAPTRQQVNRPRTTPAYKIHVVRKGDNLTKIATRYAASLKAIRRLNPKLVPNRIYPGQRIRIPT
ncbi:MAG: transglycosylase SLT domain-containing protein [Spirochaetia bacterium]